MQQNKIDLLYLGEAYKLACYSPDESTQNGAILVRDNSFFDLENILAKGINDFPKGVKLFKERLLRPLKYSFTEHAERNAIYDAARNGIKTRGLILYSPWFACEDCGRAIIQAGIKKVIGFIGPEKWEREKAKEDCKSKNWDGSIKRALEMFGEAGVSYYWVDGKIGGLKVLFDGKFVYP